MKVLTVFQPWAWAIVNGHKLVENRKIPTKHRGPLLIHAGKKLQTSPLIAETFARAGVAIPRVMDFGKIIGIVDVVNCVALDIPGETLSGGDALRGNPWAFGPWCWLLENPRAFVNPSAWVGQQALVDCPATVQQDSQGGWTISRDWSAGAPGRPLAGELF